MTIDYFKEILRRCEDQMVVRLTYGEFEWLVGEIVRLRLGQSVSDELLAPPAPSSGLASQIIDRGVEQGTPPASTGPSPDQSVCG